jgi:putative sporulation protein YtxC
MDAISIGTNLCSNQLREKLDFGKNFLVQKGIQVDINERQQGKLTFFGCKIDNIEEFLSNNDTTRPILWQSFKDYITIVLSNVITDDLERILVNKIIQNECNNYSKSEREIIYNSALEKLNIMEKEEENNIFEQIKKKNRIQLELSDYLDINNQIMLEGFIRFRLKDYFTELKIAVECAIDEFMMEKEYEEFIALLRYFVDIQEPQVDLVHVFQDEESGFKLLDKNYELIRNEYLEGFVLDMVDDDLHYEDLLISALITVAPKEIKLHLAKEADVIKTVKNIFNDKVLICKGCDYCNKVATDSVTNKVSEYDR